MLKGDAVNHHTINPERPTTQRVWILDLGLEIIKLNREETIPHFIVKSCPETFHTGGVAIYDYFGFRIIDWIEKRESPDMVPVDVCNEKMNVHLFSADGQLVTQRPDTGSGVNYNDLSAFKRDFKTGGISSVLYGVLSWYRDGPPRSPELDFHFLPISDLYSNAVFLEVSRIYPIGEFLNPANLRYPVKRVNSKKSIKKA
jgi:hypothetical protein